MNENIDCQTTVYSIIEHSFRKHRESIKAYITHKISDAELAEDLTQDVYLHLLECGHMIRPQTVKNMLYTIARNIVIDYLRRYYSRYSRNQTMDATMLECKASTIHSEAIVSASDIAYHEQMRVQMLPPQRRKVYNMVRFEEKNVAEVSKELSLSVRTVENHLAIGRREVREYIRKCISA